MVELVVNGSKIETSTGTDLTLVLNKSIADFDNISARNSSYSFDFELPPTQRNNQLLFAVSDVNAFGEIGRVNAILLVDGSEYDRGTLFAFESELDGNYTATYQSGLISWADEISNLRLNQLIWRGVTNNLTTGASEIFTASRVFTLNNANSSSQDFSYPLVNRNNDGLTSDSRPQIYLKSFINNLFATIGWTVDGSFLEEDEIKGGVVIQDQFGNDFNFNGVVIDPPFNFEVNEDIIQNSFINYDTDKEYYSHFYILGMQNGIGGGLINPLELGGFFNIEVNDDGENFDNTTYTAPYTAIYNITLDARNTHILYNGFIGSGGAFSPINNTNILAPQVTLVIFVNGVVVDSIIINDITEQFGRIINREVEMNVNDEMTFELANYGSNVNLSPINLAEFQIQLSEESNLKIQRKSTIDLSEDFVINTHLPDINCLELLQDIKLMFNLMFRTDERNKVVTIDKWEGFYQNIGVAKNYTDKIDLSEKPVISHLSDYTKELTFRYKEDSNDGYLSRWNKINERTYGQYRQALIPAQKFEEGETIFETKVISPSIQGSLNNADIIVSIARREYKNDEENGLNTGYNTRIGYFILGKQYYNNGSERSSFIIPASLMESYGNVPILDNNQLTFNGANGLIARNWTKTLATIQLGIRVSCKLLLSKYEFFNFDFTFPIFLEYPSKLKGYYLIESLNNFEVTDNNKYSTEVTLIKYKDFVGVEIDTSQGTNVNENINNTQIDDKTIVYTISNEGEVNETINRVYTVAGNGEIQNVII